MICIHVFLIFCYSIMSMNYKLKYNYINMLKLNYNYNIKLNYRNSNIIILHKLVHICPVLIYAKLFLLYQLTWEYLYISTLRIFLSVFGQMEFRLKPGELLTFNNRRILHARNKFELNGGKRLLEVSNNIVNRSTFPQRNPSNLKLFQGWV